jgi:hypothetical protein
MHVARYVTLVHESERRFGDGLRTVAEHHGDEPDVQAEAELLASWSDAQVEAIRPIVDRYGEEPDDGPDQLAHVLFHGPRSGALSLLRDLQDLWLLGNEVQMSYTVLQQAARALRDGELEDACAKGLGTTKRQLAWLSTRMKVAAPQALVVAS